MDFTTLSLAELLAYDFSTLSPEDLTAYRAEVGARFTAIQTAENITAAQAQEATDLHARHVEARAFARSQEAASDEQVEALAALSLDDDEEESEDEAEVDDEAETEEVEEPEVEVEAEVEEPEVEAEAPVKKVAAAARPRPKAVKAPAGKRPSRPAAKGRELITLTAAADTSYPAGSTLSLTDVGLATAEKLRGFPVPEGATDDGEATPDETAIRKFPVAQLGIDFPEDLQVRAGMDAHAVDEVLQRAGDESQIRNYNTGEEHDTLVAANGWCAPSETLYDLCAGEVVDGIWSLPEVQVNRGGFKHTTGIDFSTIYSGVGFLQTEAQAIAGTAKGCYEVPCPSFVDERLDAIGICIKVPILLEVGYPEAVKRVMSASMIAHQYKVNASVASRITTLAGAAIDFLAASDFASATGETLMAIDVEADILRQKYRLGVNTSMEVVVPVWARELFRTELGLRNGRGTAAPVTDAEIAAHFSARHVNVQYVYGLQEWAGTEVTFPATLEFYIYPAGTLVKGVSNVINLSAVYDAASLNTNLYTGLFFEQGLLVAKMCYEVRRVTIPVTGAFTGKMGALGL